LFALILLVSPVTWAAGDDDDDKPKAGESGEARKKFAEGNERYARGDYEGAVQAFKAAIAANPALPGPYRNLGLAYRAQGKCPEALPMYEKYLQLKPESRFTDRVKREIDLCRAKLGMEPINRPQAGTPTAPQAQSFLHVAANLIGGEATDEASVRIDGLVRGPTPLTVPVTAGVHKIHLERPGFESADAVVEVAPGERRDVELTMNKIAVAPTAPVLTDAEAAAARPRKPLRKIGWALIGAAAALGGMGAGFGIAESDVHRKAVAAEMTSTKRADIDALHEEGDKLAIGAYVGLSLGAAALAASVIVFILDGKRGETHEPQKYVVVPMATQGGGGIAAAVRF
jgi:tetratricopeptide (TPR) repeat protein